MARKPRSLAVNITPAASDQLDRIWDWNAERYNPDHADRYEDFLISEANKAGANPAIGRTVEGSPDYRYIVARRGKRRGHGHIIIYQAASKGVEVVFIFHTAQNWQARLGT